MRDACEPIDAATAEPETASDTTVWRADTPLPAAGGRPVRFRAAYIEQARKLAAMGAVDSEIADFFGIDARALARWRLAHPAFAEATKVGGEPADDRVERSLYQKAVGYHYTEQQAIKIKIQEKAGTFHEEVVVIEVERFMPPQGTADILWLKNRRPDRWRDKAETDAAEKDAGESIAKATVEGVLARLKSLDDEC